MTTRRRAAATAAFLIGLATFLGCRLPASQRALSELRDAAGWVDPAAQNDIVPVAQSQHFLELAAWASEARRPTTPFPKKSVLVLSGGGSYGAYCAGFLNGWTRTGTRPDFDVVTGVSTGELIGVLAFLGPETDAELRHINTTLRTEDVYKRRRILQSVLGESFAVPDPLAQLIDRSIPEERFRKIAAEHAKGRRLYIGTSELETRRQVIWDMGAIASRNTPEARQLFRDVVLASASIPGFFPPIRIPIDVDGVRTVERHIDGGVSASMFFAPPHVPAEARETLDPGWLHDSDLYVLVAGKLFADPVQVRFWTLAVVSNSISTIIHDQTRSDLHKVFLIAMLTGMNFHQSAIPQAAAAPTESTKFDPVELTALFEVGERAGRSEMRWRVTPPGGEPGEDPAYRGGTTLKATNGPPSVARPRRGLLGWPAGGTIVPLPGIPLAQRPGVGK